MRNIRLVLAYDGTDFHGWQRQPNQPTVQECVEKAIGRLTGEAARLWGSGRTDAGVHASNQVANFKTDCPIPSTNLVKALNDLLPPAIRVKEAAEVPGDFHARYHVKSKTYRYRILQGPVCSPFWWRFVYHYPFSLDYDAMAKAARLFEGEHDFTSFAAAEETRSQESEDRGQNPEFRIQNPLPRHSVPTPTRGHGRSTGRDEGREMVREVFVSRVIRRPKTAMLIYEVRGTGFLHHMVRNIVGTLMEVGRGKLAPRDVERIFKARDRRLAGPTAPAQGLCLVKVEY